MRPTGPASILLVCAAACGVAEGGSRATPGERPVDALAAGRPAPPLDGIDLDGGRFRLSEARGDVVALVFHRSPACGICRSRLRALAARRSAYEDLGARVVAVVPAPPDAWEEIADDVDVPIVAVDRAALQRWGLWPAGEPAPRPAAFVLDPRGRVRFRHIGASAADRAGDLVLLAAVRAARRKAPPAPAR